jgi:DNA-binding CsgD family transcriptional regulator
VARGEGLDLMAAAGLMLAHVDRSGPGRATGHLQRRLSRREREVLANVAEGHSSKEIGGLLGLSSRTVERHLANLYAKIGARGRADAIAVGLRMRALASTSTED